VVHFKYPFELLQTNTEQYLFGSKQNLFVLCGAIFAAILLTSSLVSSLAAERRPGSFS
jgi:hypothetical protein